MPWAPPKHCPRGHPSFTGSQCPVCAAERKKAADARRPSASARGYSEKWRKASRSWLASPGRERCVHCGGPAEMVDHRIAPKGDMKLFWDVSNWQPSCRACNTRKAIREEGGFGNAVSR
ncbi:MULTISPECIES: HNH endonuclease [unclassified Xanthobacter]|uniref:HNH endonuclease signature motif containing protein n=1 Tax=unclassified Xanthobacter TaxID=2623496 RepID=UPI001F21A522|nr:MULTISPECIES: HNH endonuclease [unclassified Xanthobacter]